MTLEDTSEIVPRLDKKVRGEGSKGTLAKVSLYLESQSYFKQTVSGWLMLQVSLSRLGFVKQ
jgi:hypothetical protein